MKHLRALAATATLAALAVGICAPSAQAATTPKSKVKADLAYVTTLQKQYAKSHHGNGKGLFVAPGKSTRLVGHKVTARPKEYILTFNASVGKRHGFCLIVQYLPYHDVADDHSHVAFYDSLLKRRSLDATHPAPGGACAEPEQREWKSQMRSDLHDGIQDIETVIADNSDAVFNFKATYNHPVTIGSGVQVRAAFGDTVLGHGNLDDGYCVTVVNPKVHKLAGHAYHFSNINGQVHPGRYSTDPHDPCAKPTR